MVVFLSTARQASAGSQLTRMGSKFDTVILGALGAIEALARM